MTDLDELATRCRTPLAREHIAEAIASYRAGAYRAAIVMSWIAVVFDLVDKVRDLSVAGEPAATSLMQTFENYQGQIHAGNATAMKQALEFERDLLVRVRSDLSLLDALQLSDLERLREDRHRSAHPSFNRAGEAFKPPAELARLHLRNAIAHVLSQPPVQGKAALSRLKTLVGSDYFPPDRTRARTQLESSGLAHASDGLVRAFIDELIFGYVTSTHDLYGQKGAITALDVVLDMYRGEAEPRASQQIRRIVRTATDAELPTAVELVAAWPTGWLYLEQPEREKITEFTTTAAYDVLEPSVPGLATISDLHAPLKGRLLSLTTTQLEALLAEDGMADFGADAAVAKYLAAASYSTARGRRRRLIKPHLDRLTAGHVKAIIAGAGANNQVREETYFPTFLRKLGELGLMPPSEFKSHVEEAGMGGLLEEEEDEDEI